MAHKHEKMFKSLFSSERNIKTIMRFILTPTRRAMMKKTDNSKCQGGFRETGALIHCWESVLVQSLWETVSQLFYNVKNTLSLQLKNPTPRNFPKRNGICPQKDLDMNVHSSTVLNNQIMETTQESISW